jgi:CRP/FNR family transcriptional regulator, cyclic AMP receptor protein
MSNTGSHDIQQMSDLLRSGTAFDGMPALVANRVVALMHLRSVAAGELLTQEGVGNSGQLMLVVSGEAEISSRSIQDGGHLVHRVAKPGHIIGEVGFIDNQAHSATCEATMPMRVAVLERDVFMRMFEADTLSAAQLMAGLLRLLARRIRHANRYMLAQDQQLLKLQTELLTLHKPQPLR